MDNLLDKNFSIDKSTWIKVKLGDVVAEPKESVKDFSKEQIEHVVGLEHIDSEDIHLRRSESMEESTTFTKKFSTGDVLFGRRRAYLKKAAQAEFSGICSGDITVMRVKNGLSADLLPFVIHNEKFFDYAITHSAGGLSPRVKFKDLANYEFLLPPKEQQPQLAELLWAMDDAVEKEQELKELAELQAHIYLNKSFRYGAFLNQASKDSIYGKIPRNWSVRKLSELGEFKNGINKGKDQFGFGKPFVNLLDVFGYKDIHTKDFDLVNVSDNEVRTFNVCEGDVLFIRSSVKPSGVGLTTLVRENLKDTVYSGFIIRFRPLTNELAMMFKKYCFFEERFRYSLCRRSTISANTNINQESLNKLYLPVPPDSEQEEFSVRMSEFESVIIKIKDKLSQSKKLQKFLINQAF